MIEVAVALVGLAVVLVTAAAVVSVFPSSKASAGPSCSDIWIGGNGDWNDASDWSTGNVPAGTDTVCITATTTTTPAAAADTYTVTVNSFPSGDITSLDLGGTGGTQTLAIDSGINFSVTGSTAINSNGVMDLGGTGSSAVILAGGSSGLTNSGHISAEANSGQPDSLNSGLDNATGGTIDINAGADLGDSSGAAFTNDGSISTSATGSFNGSGNGTSFDNDAGTITNDGSFSFQGGGGFTEGDGTTTGNPIDLPYASLSFTGTGASSFDMTEGGGVISGDMVSGQNVAIDANSATSTSINYATPATMAGSLSFINTGGASGSSAYLAIQNEPSALTIASGGTFTVDAPGATVQQGGYLTNDGTVTIDTAFNPGPCNSCYSVITNDGTFGVASTGSVASGGANGNLFTNNGDLSLASTAVFTWNGGGPFTQNSAGTFTDTIDAISGNYGLINGGGDASIAGTLDITTVGSPAMGSMWEIIDLSQGSSGAFANCAYGSTCLFNSTYYTVTNPSYGVTTLVAGGSDATVTEPSSTTGTGTALPVGGVSVGSTVYDAATVTGNSSTQSPSGDVDFYVCSPATLLANSATTCNSSIGTQFDTETLPAGSGPPVTAYSMGQTVASAGTWCFAGYYSGDTTFPASSDTSSDECFTVTKGTATVTTTANPAANGGDATDSVAVTGGGATPTGTATFYYCYSASVITTCSSAGTEIEPGSEPVTLVDGDATSPSITVENAGTYCFFASYSGDSNYAGLTTSDLGNECFTVSGAATVTTTANPAAIGGDASDSVAVSGGGATPTGTATFYYCYSASVITTCSSAGTEIDPGSEPVALNRSGDATSPSITVENAGTYCFFASYSGDSNYAGPTTTDLGIECFTVATGSGTAIVTTTANPAAIGGDASDSVTVTGGGASPTGTATFYYCYSASVITTCSSSGTEIDPGSEPVTLVDGDATSPSLSITNTGTYCFFASYSGDSNYAGPTTTDLGNECFTVATGSGTAIVTTTATSAGIGGDASDSVVVSGPGAAPTGTATFYYCYSASVITTCSSAGTEINPGSEPVTLVDGDGTSPSITVENAGSYCFFASYSGDSNYAGPTTTDLGNECFTVATGTAPPSPPTTTPFPTQIYGIDAIGTSIAISEAEYPTAGSAHAVVLARDDFFSDALAGGPLAAAVDGPLLITEGAPISSTLDPRVQAEIERVLPKGGTVYILGGDLALSPDIDTTLEDLGYIVVREAGIDEYATAVDIANTLATTSWGTPSTIFEATGLYFYDALSAVPAAIKEHAAILLTDGSIQSPETAAYLAGHPGDTRYAIGGPLAALGADPTAIGIYGQDLFNTSAAVASYFFPHSSIVGVATAADFPDSLGGGVFMATGGRLGPILLVNPSTPLPPEIVPYLASLTIGTQCYVFGGPLAVGPAVLAALQAAIG
jgi:hypothetical protein